MESVRGTPSLEKFNICRIEKGERMLKKIYGVKNLPGDAVYSNMASPVGTLIIVVSKLGVHAIMWDRELDSKNVYASVPKEEQHPLCLSVKGQLNGYFEKKRTAFDLPLVMAGTDFQVLAWQTLQTIPYGQTISYGEQAQRLGDKRKARAVGMANGKNPISIVVPCHRVIGSSGKLTGFGGGLENKHFLLELESEHCGQGSLSL
jgi:methylated-DNA-[protein]-cysteine S-methyltransferase